MRERFAGQAFGMRSRRNSDGNAGTEAAEAVTGDTGVRYLTLF
jgi:hypothetical protein